MDHPDWGLLWPHTEVSLVLPSSLAQEEVHVLWYIPSVMLGV